MSKQTSGKVKVVVARLVVRSAVRARLALKKLYLTKLLAEHSIKRTVLIESIESSLALI